ncbi:hypothetical protein Pgy4_31316, partial [Pseudomonas savastanoi pv. glycinea str. race 4]
KLPWNDRRMLYVPWSWCVTAALTFLPVGVTLMAVFVRLKPKTSLHGDARFANDRELRQFEYQGEYKNTSKARKYALRSLHVFRQQTRHYDDHRKSARKK